MDSSKLLDTVGFMTLRIYARELTQSQISAVVRIKDWIERVINDRNRLTKSAPVIKPSLYWQFFTEAFSYVKAMPPEEFKTLRLHTYHLDGGTYQRLFSASFEKYKARYDFLCQGVPERFRINGPQMCGEYGYLYNEGVVNDSVLRWQELIKALLQSGELTRLDKSECPVFLEIGGGYGSLAYHFRRMFPKSLYIIVDIPETLLFSAAYLTLIHGEDSVFLMHRENEFSLGELKQYSFVLIPNYMLSCLSSLHFDFSLNVQSFQEMTKEQVNEYLKFLSPRTDVLLSWNRDRQYFSREEVTVSNQLRQLFELRELPSCWAEPKFRRLVRTIFGRRYKKTKMMFEDGRRKRPLNRFLAFPKGASADA